MPRELVLMTREALSFEVLLDLAERFTDGGDALVYGAESSDEPDYIQYVDSSGRSLATVFRRIWLTPPGQETLLDQAEQVVGPIPEGMTTWTEVTIPFDAPPLAWGLVCQLRAISDGVLVERT